MISMCYIVVYILCQAHFPATLLATSKPTPNNTMAGLDAGQWMEDEDTGVPSPRVARRAVGSSNREALTRELQTLKLQAQVAQQTRLNASVGMWTIQVPFEVIAKPLAVAKTFATAPCVWS